LRAALHLLTTDGLVDACDLRAVGEGIWTSMALNDPDGSMMILLVSGDWTILDRTLNPFVTTLTLALACVRDRAARRRAESVLVDGYTMARRLSRLGGVETVCQRVVAQVAQSTGADRVALALYRSEDDRLPIAA